MPSLLLTVRASIPKGQLRTKELSLLILPHRVATTSATRREDERGRPHRSSSQSGFANHCLRPASGQWRAYCRLQYRFNRSSPTCWQPQLRRRTRGSTSRSRWWFHEDAPPRWTTASFSTSSTGFGPILVRDDVVSPAPIHMRERARSRAPNPSCACVAHRSVPICFFSSFCTEQGVRQVLADEDSTRCRGLSRTSAPRAKLAA